MDHLGWPRFFCSATLCLAAFDFANGARIIEALAGMR